MRLALLALFLIFALAGCSSHTDALTYHVGELCTVAVRPSSLGKSGPSPAPLNATTIDGAQVSVSGKLVASDDRWVTLNTGGAEEVVINRNDVLSVTVPGGDR